MRFSALLGLALLALASVSLAAPADSVSSTLPQDSTAPSETELTSCICERTLVHIKIIEKFLLEAAAATVGKDVNWKPALSKLGNLLEDIIQIIGESGNPAAVSSAIDASSPPVVEKATSLGEVSSATSPYGLPVDQKAMPEWLKQLSLSLGNDLREYLFNRFISLSNVESESEGKKLLKKIIDMLMLIGNTAKPPNVGYYMNHFKMLKHYAMNLPPEDGVSHNLGEFQVDEASAKMDNAMAMGH